MSTSHLHEAVHLIHDEKTGLSGVIAIHSTRLGPAAGGCRVWHYDDHAALVTDALRLSQGMSYKNAVAGLPFGGGKAVLAAPLGTDRAEVFRAFGRAVERLNGAYVTAEDVGTSVADMSVVREVTEHVAGLPTSAEGDRAGGDPSPWTALGVFLSIQQCVRSKLGADLKGITVAVQGLGNVGQALCQMLAHAGARLVVADPVADRVEKMRALHGAASQTPETIHSAAVDVFAPCALGAGLNPQTIPDIRAQIVCGAANNQLASDDCGQLLRNHGVLYAPDYVVNAGGIINVAAEHLLESRDDVEHRVRQIPQRLQTLIDRADARNLPLNQAADQMAEELIRAGAVKLAA